MPKAMPLQIRRQLGRDVARPVVTEEPGATQGGNALLDAQALEDNPDLLFDREPPAGLPPDVLNDLLC